MDAMVCATCGRMLERLTKDGQESWIHSVDLVLPQDHVVVPVPPTDLVPDMRCDFCFAVVTEGYTVPSGDFPMPVPDGNVHMSRGDWLACERCARLITTDRWEWLVARAERAHMRRHSNPPPEYAEFLSGLLGVTYGLLKDNMTGPVRRASREEMHQRS